MSLCRSFGLGWLLSLSSLTFLPPSLYPLLCFGVTVVLDSFCLTHFVCAVSPHFPPHFFFFVVVVVFSW